MPTLPEEFQIPEPGKYALLATVKLVVEAPPLMVKRPDVIVEEAFERNPPLNMLAMLEDVATRYCAST
jgi:hypothetical protein